MGVFDINNKIIKIRVNKPIKATSLVLSQTELSLEGLNVTKKLTYSFLPANAISETIYFKSLDTAIATVDSSGNVKSIKAGECTIVAYNQEETLVAQCRVTVTIPATAISLNSTNYNFSQIGGNYRLITTVTPSNCTDTIKYKSSNTDIVEVFDNGTIVAKAKGSAVITATAGSKSATCNVVVGIAVSSVALNKSSHSFLFSNETTQLIATVLPNNATDKTLKWTSNNESVATVSETGVVTAKGSGSCTITATSVADSTKKASCTINVNISPTGIEIDKSSVILNAVNATASVIATVLPSNANNKTVTWSTSNSSVATVSNGTITAKGGGNCTITATNSAGHKAYVTVLVQLDVQSLTLQPSSITLYGINKTASIIPKITPDNASNQTLTWSLSNSDIATVVDGIVTAKANGTATITATAYNGIKATATVQVRVPVDSVTLSKNLYETNTPNGSFTLSANILPSNSAVRTVSWSTSNSSVATVSNGTVTIRGFGEAIIKATADGKEDTCLIKVKEALLEKIVLEKTSCLFNQVNQTFQINYSLQPANTYNKTVTFTKVSGDFTVSNTGLVTCTGLKGGTITVKGSNNISTTFTVRIDAVGMVNSVYREKISNLRTSMQNANNKIAQIKTDTAKDDIKNQIDKLQTGYDKEIGELDKAVSNIKNDVLAGIEDNVLTEIEKAKIEASLASLATEKADVDAEYEKVYNNKDLVDTTTYSPKTNLKNMYDQYVRFYNYLVSDIEDMLEANEITNEMKGILNRRFENHDRAYSLFKASLQTAINAIADRKSQLAIGEAKTYTDAKIKVESDRITSTVTKVTELGDKVSSAQSTITQLSNAVVSKVDVNGVKSIIQQNPSSIQIGFNKISNVVEITANGINLRTSTGDLHTRLYNGTVNFMKKSNPDVSLGKFQRNTWTNTTVEGLFCNMDKRTTYGVGFFDGSYYTNNFIVAGETVKLSNNTVYKGTNLLDNLYMHNHSIKNVGSLEAGTVSVTNKVTNGQFICTSNYVKAPFVLATSQMKAPAFIKTTVTRTSSYNAKTCNIEHEDVEINTHLTDTITPNTEYIGIRTLKGDTCKISIPKNLLALGSNYVIQLTPVGDKKIYVAEKSSDYFLVKGEECEFDFIVKMLTSNKNVAKAMSDEALEAQARMISEANDNSNKPDIIKLKPEDFR